MSPWETFFITIGIILAASGVVWCLEIRERRRLERERKDIIAGAHGRSRMHIWPPEK